MVYPNACSESNNSSENLEIGSGLVELAGPRGQGKTEWLLRQLARKSDVRAAWIFSRPDDRGQAVPAIFPSALPEYGVALERVLFIESAADQVLWAAHQVLKSQVFEWVVLDAASGSSSSGRRAQFEETELRRLQLVSEKSEAAVILLNEERMKQGTWPLSMQLEISRREVRVLKQRIACRVAGAQESEWTGAIPVWGQAAWQRLGLLQEVKTG